jgi:hypothetical protein
MCDGDDTDAIWGAPSPDTSLCINSTFAARFDAASRAVAEQRRAALLSSVLVPPHVCRAVQLALAAALSQHPTACRLWAPPELLGEVLRRNKLRPEGGSGGGAPPASGPEAAAALEDFLGAGAGRAAVGKLLRWARGRAHMALAERGAGRGGGKRARVAEDASGGSDDGEGAAAQPPLAPLPLAPPLAPPLALLLKRRGRGCGRGRGLTAAGEPPFESMHPSWQARRRMAARQGKVIRRELHDAVERVAAAAPPVAT